MFANFIITVLVVTVGGAVGGLFYGITNSGGAVWPKNVTTQHKVNDKESFKLTMTVLGIVGNVIIGSITALAIFCLYGEVGEVVVVGDSTNLGSIQLTIYQIGVSIVAGASGGKAIGDAVKNRQWEKVRSAMGAINPQVRVTQDPIEAAISMSTEVSVQGLKASLGDPEILYGRVVGPEKGKS